MAVIREEEKLARDVYITLGEQWGLPIFASIAESEQRHMDAFGRLIDKYGLEDPVTDTVREGLLSGHLVDHPSSQIWRV